MAAFKPPPPLLVVAVVLLLLALESVPSSARSEAEVLVAFKSSLANASSLSGWSPTSTPCEGDKENWVGILCTANAIWGLKLENLGLSGPIDVDTLKELPSLRSISLMNNSFEGQFPHFNKLPSLRSLYLSNNKFSGEIDSNAFDGMNYLKKIHLENNQFTGMIPISLTLLPRLVEVNLAGNKFEGQIPSIQPDKLRSINVANNQLDGQIPPVLSHMAASSFSGNPALCGAPLEPCDSVTKLPVATIVVVAIVVGAALAAIAAVFVILRQRRQNPQSNVEAPSVHANKKAAAAEAERKEGSAHSTASRRGEMTGKLSFLRDDKERFDLGDLLKASAEVLGSGYFGSSYKAALTTGKAMVVKRFRHMNNVGREEFQEHMRRLGRLNHNNLLPVVAFYYRKEEKLLVSDYVANVSLAVHLHGNRGSSVLDWPTRLKIIKGVAQGLSYLYAELPSLIVPHGHLKSSNVLLGKSFEPLLTDYALVPVVNPEHAQEVLVAYKSPEYKLHGRVTKKTDVWSLGILILEILTGKFPANYLQQGKGSDTDLVTLVLSLVREERMEEVFDKDMGSVRNAEEEVMKMLKIGLACAETNMEKRLDLKEAIERIEQVKEKEHDGEQFYSLQEI
ncbi:Non-specific serine/threonine protein kinase [Bertholletia excelsa]